MSRQTEEALERLTKIARPYASYHSDFGLRLETDIANPPQLTVGDLRLIRAALRALSGTEAPAWFVEEMRQSVGTIMNAGDAETEAKRERAEANHLWSARPASSPETGPKPWYVVSSAAPDGSLIYVRYPNLDGESVAYRRVEPGALERVVFRDLSGVDREGVIVAQVGPGAVAVEFDGAKHGLFVAHDSEGRETWDGDALIIARQYLRPYVEQPVNPSAPGEQLEAVLRRMERSAHNQVQPSTAYWCREIRHALSLSSSPETGGYVRDLEPEDDRWPAGRNDCEDAPSTKLNDALSIMRNAKAANLAACLVPAEVDAVLSALSVSPETGVERERLAKLVDVEVRSREASAGDARRVYADKRVAAFEAEAADWRAIASIVRFASPGVREETIQGVLMVFVSDGYVLMERCPKKAARHGGEWFIPGGRIEAGESPFEAFVRETREELGVSVPDCAALPLVDATGGEAFGSFLMRPYLVTRWEGCIPHVSLDHPDVPLRWVPFEEAHRSPAAAVRAIMAYVDRPGGEQPA